MIHEKAIATLFENTATVLREAPLNKAAVRRDLLRASAQADEAGATDQHQLLLTLVALLDQGSGAASDLTARVPAAYRDPWDVLIAQMPWFLGFEQISEIIRKTSSVMLQTPIRKRRWKESMQALAQQADLSGDLDGSGFLNAIVALIERGTSSFGELTASIPESYEDVWNALGILLRQPLKPDAC